MEPIKDFDKIKKQIGERVKWCSERAEREFRLSYQFGGILADLTEGFLDKTAFTGDNLHSGKIQEAEYNSDQARGTYQMLRAVLRGNLKEYVDSLRDISRKNRLSDLVAALERQPYLFYNHFRTLNRDVASIPDTLKEYAENEIYKSIRCNDNIKMPCFLKVSCAEYLSGMLEVIGELRRGVREEERNQKHNYPISYLDDVLNLMEFIHSSIKQLPTALKRKMKIKSMIDNMSRTIGAFQQEIENRRRDETIRTTEQKLEILAKKIMN